MFESFEPRVLLSTWYVDSGAPGAGADGTSWATAFPDLQQALGPAVAGDEIRVADGVYLPTGTGDRSATFQLKSGVAIRGGYAGLGVDDPDAREFGQAPTILSGEINSASDVDNSYHVLSGSGVDATAIVDRVTITGGHANALGTDFHGGGIYISAGSPSFIDCTFGSNRAGSEGGAVYAANNSSPTFTGCTFIGNISTNLGGAIAHRSGSAPVITSSTFTQNQSYWGGAVGGYDAPATMTISGSLFISNTAQEGGAVWGNSSAMQLSGSMFSKNVTNYLGGAVYLGGGTGSAFVNGCTFYANTAGLGNGGAMCIAAGAAPTVVNSIMVGNSAQSGGAVYFFSGGGSIINCTIAYNLATSGGHGIYFNGSSAAITNCIVWGAVIPGAMIGIAPFGGGTQVVSYSDVLGGYSGATNTGDDPKFHRPANPGGDGTWGTWDDDFGDLRPRLSPPTTVIDGGDSTAVPAGITTDYAGNPRIANVINQPGTGVDMGAYEYLAPFRALSGEYDPSLASIEIHFNGDVRTTSLAAGDLILHNHTTNQTFNAGGIAEVSYDAGAQKATWSIVGVLPDGNYTATLPSTSVLDGAGVTMSAHLTFDFYVLAGDINRDRVVDLRDLYILSLNWLETGRSYSEGDLNLDGTVDRIDLTILARGWQKRVDPLDPPPATPVLARRAGTRPATRVMEQVNS